MYAHAIRSYSCKMRLKYCGICNLEADSLTLRLDAAINNKLRTNQVN